MNFGFDGNFINCLIIPCGFEFVWFTWIGFDKCKCGVDNSLSDVSLQI